jgi:hypothetical protein
MGVSLILGGISVPILASGNILGAVIGPTIGGILLITGIIITIASVSNKVKAKKLLDTPPEEADLEEKDSTEKNKE